MGQHRYLIGKRAVATADLDVVGSCWWESGSALCFSTVAPLNPSQNALSFSCLVFYVTWRVETVMLSRSSIPLTSVGPHRHCHSYPPVKMSVHILHGSSVPTISSSRPQHLILFSVLKLCMRQMSHFRSERFDERYHVLQVAV